MRFKSSKLNIIIVVLLCLTLFLEIGFFAMLRKDDSDRVQTLPTLEGQNLSILGDSISTFNGISNNSSTANSTIGNNAVWYPHSPIDVSSKTWWAQVCTETGMNLLVNNSWSGSKVLSGSGAGYVDRCVQLHGNIGVNAGVRPDIIAVYLGINDLGANTPCNGDFRSTFFTKIESDGFVPTTFDEAYAVMIYKMTNKYSKADTYCFTLPKSVNNSGSLLVTYNTAIESIASHYGCGIVDLYTTELSMNYSVYTIDNLHPNEVGMDIMTDSFIDVLAHTYVVD